MSTTMSPLPWEDEVQGPDDSVLAAQIGLRLMDENAVLQSQIKALREDLEEQAEQMTSLKRQAVLANERRLEQDLLIKSFQVKEKEQQTVITELESKVGVLQAKTVAIAQVPTN